MIPAQWLFYFKEVSLHLELSTQIILTFNSILSSMQFYKINFILFKLSSISTQQTCLPVKSLRVDKVPLIMPESKTEKKLLKN